MLTCTARCHAPSAAPAARRAALPPPPARSKSVFAPRSCAEDAAPTCDEEYTLSCEHFDRGLDVPPLLADARAFFAARGVADFRLATGAVHGWRNRARLAVRRGGGPGAPLVVGLFAAASHDVVPVPRCAVHHPRVNAAVEVLNRAAAAADTAAYDESSPAAAQHAGGALRYVQLATHGTAAQAAVEVSLVWASPPPPPGAPPPPQLVRLTTALCELAPPGLIAAVWANYHPAAGNAVVGPHWARLPGGEQSEEWHWERFGGAEVAFAPGAFLQSNYGAFDALCAAVAEALPAGCQLVDFYAGTGPLGLAALASGAAARLTAVEVTPAAAAPFAASAARLAAAQGRRDVPASMCVAPAGGNDALALLAEGDALIVDPPRRGLDAALLAALCAAPEGRGPARRIITLCYVSCGFEALKRDADALLRAGWVLESARAFQFFPGTDALETLAVFTRIAVDDAHDADAPLPTQAVPAAAAKPRRRRR